MQVSKKNFGTEHGPIWRGKNKRKGGKNSFPTETLNLNLWLLFLLLHPGKAGRFLCLLPPFAILPFARGPRPPATGGDKGMPGYSLEYPRFQHKK